jgi:hypothetical protein
MSGGQDRSASNQMNADIGRVQGGELREKAGGELASNVGRRLGQTSLGGDLVKHEKEGVLDLIMYGGDW